MKFVELRKKYKVQGCGAASVKTRADESYYRYRSRMEDGYALSNEDTVELIKAYRKEKDVIKKERLLDKLVRHNQGIVIGIATKHGNPSNINDYTDICNIGLLKAIETYDIKHASNSSFSTYAITIVYNHLMKESIQYRGEVTNKMLYAYTGLWSNIRKFKDKFYQENERYPTGEEIYNNLRKTYPRLTATEELISRYSNEFSYLPMYIDEIEDEEVMGFQMGDIISMDSYNDGESDNVDKEIINRKMDIIKNILKNYLENSKSEKEKERRTRYVKLLLENYGIGSFSGEGIALTDLANKYGFSSMFVQSCVLRLTKMLRKEIKKYDITDFVTHDADVVKKVS